MNRRLSPIQPSQNLKELAFQTRLMTDLLKVHNTLLEQVAKHNDNAKQVLGKAEEVRKALEESRAQISQINSLPKGEKGDKGDKGDFIQGPKGRDGVDGKDAVVNIPAIISQIQAGIRQPEDGKDAQLNQDELLNALLKRIREEKLLKTEDVQGLEQTARSYASQFAGVNNAKGYVHGGGTTVSAGSNITLVPKADGTVEINASGGGSGTNVITQYQLTAVQSGSDVTIDLTQLTNWATFTDLIAIYRNNVPQTETVNFTFAGSTVTIFNADASEIFNATYAYA